jgi:hypothetical protein
MAVQPGQNLAQIVGSRRRVAHQAQLALDRAVVIRRTSLPPFFGRNRSMMLR